MLFCIEYLRAQDNVGELNVKMIIT